MVVLVSGFWVLATSPFTVVGHLGLLTGVIILLALAVNLLFLPAVLLTFEKKTKWSKPRFRRSTNGKNANSSLLITGKDTCQAFI